MMVRLRAAPPRHRRGAERVRSRSRCLRRRERRQLRALLQVRHHRDLRRGRAGHARLRAASAASRRPSEVGRDPHAIATGRSPSAIVPMVLLVAYWFLLLAPKREEAATASKDSPSRSSACDAGRGRREHGQAREDELRGRLRARSCASARPSRRGVDMPSLVVQLDRAAAGTGIRFTQDRDGRARRRPRPRRPRPAAPADAGRARAAPRSQAGGETAQSALRAAPSRPRTTPAAQQTSRARRPSSPASARPTPRPPPRAGGGLPVGGGAGAPGRRPAAASAPGLDTVPLELEFVGNFFNLADFFHDIKRFVRVANRNVIVERPPDDDRGSEFSSDPELFPRIKAEITATVYLVPEGPGRDRRRDPVGPAPATGATPTPAGTTTPEHHRRPPRPRRRPPRRSHEELLPRPLAGPPREAALAGRRAARRWRWSPSRSCSRSRPRSPAAAPVARGAQRTGAKEPRRSPSVKLANAGERAPRSTPSTRATRSARRRASSRKQTTAGASTNARSEPAAGNTSGGSTLG